MELSYEALKEMDYNTFKKTFKKKPQWKKAKAIVFLKDFKFGSKKTMVAFPVRRPAELKKIHKAIKDDKHPNAKMAICKCLPKTNEDGSKGFELEVIKGKLKEEDLLNKGNQLFEQHLSLQLAMQAVGEAVSAAASIAAESAEVAAGGQEELEATADATKSAFLQFKNEIVPAFKSQQMTEEQQAQLESISEQFQAFLEQVQQSDNKEKYAKLMQAVQKAAAAILKMQPKGEGSGDIINDDNVFSEDERAAIKTLVKDIKQGFEQVKSQVVPNLKSNSATNADKQVLSQLIEQIDRFEDNYEAAPAAVKSQLGKFNDKVSTQKAKLQQMIQKLEEQLGADALNEVLSPEQRKEVMEQAKQGVQNIMKELEELKAMMAG